MESQLIIFSCFHSFVVICHSLGIWLTSICSDDTILRWRRLLMLSLRLLLLLLGMMMSNVNGQLMLSMIHLANVWTMGTQWLLRWWRLMIVRVYMTVIWILGMMRG